MPQKCILVILMVFILAFSCTHLLYLIYCVLSSKKVRFLIRLTEINPENEPKMK